MGFYKPVVKHTYKDETSIETGHVLYESVESVIHWFETYMRPGNNQFEHFELVGVEEIEISFIKNLIN